MATVTETLRAFAAVVSLPVSIFIVAVKVGKVSDAAMVCDTAFSIEVMLRPSPGTSTCGKLCATSFIEGRARCTSAAVITPSGPLPATKLMSTPKAPATLRA